MRYACGCAVVDGYRKGNGKLNNVRFVYNTKTSSAKEIIGRAGVIMQL